MVKKDNLEKYFENLDFQSGKKINVSGKVDGNFCDILHWHPYAELLVSLCDSNEVTVNFVTYQLKTNDILFVYPGSLHSVHYMAEDSFLVIQFPLDLLTTMNDLRQTVTMLASDPLLKYDSRSQECGRIQLLARQIHDSYDSADPFRETITYFLLLQMFIGIGRVIVSAGSQALSGRESQDSKTTRLITEACLYISENCARQISLEEVSHHIGMSRSHFSHLFKHSTHMTFIDYLTAERIRRAEYLLLDPKMHIVDIAFEAGFSSISSFNRAFRRLKGCSPTQFRKAGANQGHP